MEIAYSLRGTIRRHPGRVAVAAVILVGLGGFALYWYAPWNLFIDKRVAEAPPGVTSADAPAPEPVPAPQATGAPATAVEEQATIAEGAFASLEHATSGTALVVVLEDGTRFLRLQDLDTSNGPDLRVILSDQPPSDDWRVWDDGRYVDLGGLKGNLGSSNYSIPSDVDLADFETAVIWCRRFSVGFGVAPLDPSR